MNRYKVSVAPIGEKVYYSNNMNVAIKNFFEEYRNWKVMSISCYPSMKDEYTCNVAMLNGNTWFTSVEELPISINKKARKIVFGLINIRSNNNYKVLL